MIIGIGGRIGHGKDAIAARLAERWDFAVVPFAKALKEEVLERLPRTLRVLHDKTCGTADFALRRPTHDTTACIRDMVYRLKPPGVRELLQEYGTEVRRRDDEDYWARQWRRVAWQAAVAGGCVAAPDTRFPNEADAVRKAGGRLWHVIRPAMRDDIVDLHSSETGILEIKWDVEIVNDGTLDQLWAKVDELMEGRS